MVDLSRLCLRCFRDKGQYEVCPHCGYAAGMDAGQSYYLQPGTILAGRYIIGTVIGFGGFGITYKAFDAKLDMIIAIKEFYPNGMVCLLYLCRDIYKQSVRRLSSYDGKVSGRSQEYGNVFKRAGYCYGV